MMYSAAPESRPWRTMGASVTGAGHLRRGLSNQDAFHLWSGSSRDSAIMSVADGHGGAVHFRSAMGALMAARVATELLKQVAFSTGPACPPPGLQEEIQSQLPERLVYLWRQRVSAHVGRYPFGRGELAQLAQREGEAAVERVYAWPALAYGSTLIASLITPTFILYCQLGDGDILLVDAQKVVTRPPLAKDDRLLGNETTSLCGRQAWHDVRISIQPLSGPAPALILLSTDGYANSFGDPGGFLEVGSDLLESLRCEGEDALRLQLPEWLAATSAAGSGDDITVTLAWPGTS